MLNCGDDELDKALIELDIKRIKVDQSEVDRSVYEDILHWIKIEWDKKLQGAERNPRLNEHEAIQFLQIYKRRRELLEEGRSDDVWFLSTETVFEKVYLRAPHKWLKPPTFPLSAWAGFLDSRIVFEQKNRRDLLTAILKGSSTAYGLPEPEEIIRRKAFGENKVLSESEAEALQLAISDGTIMQRLEKAIGKLRGKRRARFTIDEIKEFEEASQRAVGEVEAGLKEKISNLEEKLLEYRELSAAEKRELEREIERLKTTIKKLSKKEKKGKISKGKE
jgi:hypothetical protein